MPNHDDEWEDVTDHDSQWEDVPFSKAEMDAAETAATQAATDKYNAEKPGYFDSFRLGALEGVSRDWSAEAISKAQHPGNARDYEDHRNQIEQKINQGKNENPRMFGLGEFAGMLSSSPITRNPATAAGIGATEGVVKSLGGAKKIDSEAAARAAVSGAADGLIAGGVTKYGTKALDAVKDSLEPLAKYFKGVAGRQAVKSMGANQGMMTKLRDKGLTEDVGNYALDNDIVNSWRTNKSMNRKAGEVVEKYSQQKNPIYEAAAGSTMTKDDLLQAIGKRMADLEGEAGSVPVAEKMAKYGKHVEQARREVYNPESVGKFRQAVDRNINWKTGKPSSQEGGREMRKLLREHEMGLIEKHDPALAKQNEGIFRNIRLGEEAQDLTRRGEARDAANNLIGLRNSLAMPGVGMAAGAMTGSGAFGTAVGAATGLGAEIARRYGNQWGAVTARKVAQAASGEAYRPLFEAAMSKGGSAIPVLHQMLMKDDPEYRAQIEEGDNQSRVMHARDLP